MNKHQLQSSLRSKGTAYLLWFLLGTHYAYLKNWGLQVLYWITLGGMGLWAIYDLLTMGSKVDKYNARIFQQIDLLEDQMRQKEHAQNFSTEGTGYGRRY